MAPQQGSGACGGLSGGKVVALLLFLGVGVYIVGRPLYWRLVEGVAAAKHVGSCAPCVCDCSKESASNMPPGFVNTSTSDCAKVDPVMQEELDKSSLELLTEELKLQETVADESQQRADSALLEAKKLGSQYQKEAEKCNAGMETCEGAREKAEAALIAQKKISAVWEQRAKQVGWQEGKEKAEHQSLFSRIGLTDFKGEDQAKSTFYKRRTQTVS